MIDPSPQTLLDEIDLLKWKKKRRVALVVGYSGTGRLSSSLLMHHHRYTFRKSKHSRHRYTCVGYHGNQINGEIPTIEKEIVEAMHEAKCITTLNRMNTKQISLSRTSRTDKGVHASSLVVS